MKSNALKDLNFRNLFDIPQHYSPFNLPARHRYFPPRDCVSFCVDCEVKGICTTRKPYRMSHGADSEDIEQALGFSIPLHQSGKITKDPVMFLGIEPGGEYGNDELLIHPTLSKYQKKVPINHYYWTSPSIDLPKSPEKVTGVPGPFFVYLIYRFGFRNAYFSNIVKCRLWDTQRLDKHGNISPGEVDIKPDKYHMIADHKIRHNCIQKYLLNEISIHQPKVIFVLGERGMKLLADEPEIDQRQLVPLIHYGYVNRHQISIDQYVEECEQKILDELQNRHIT